jgi:hypothetical protein
MLASAQFFSLFIVLVAQVSEHDVLIAPMHAFAVPLCGRLKGTDSRGQTQWDRWPT